MMSKDEIVQKINDFLIDEFEVETENIKPENNLKETLDLDSLDYVDLVVEIENNFGFKVKAEDFTEIHTFEDFYNFVINKVNNN